MGDEIVDIHYHWRGEINEVGDIRRGHTGDRGDQEL